MSLLYLTRESEPAIQLLMRLPCALKTKILYIWLNISATTKKSATTEIYWYRVISYFLVWYSFEKKKSKDGKANVKTRQPGMFAFYHLVISHWFCVKKRDQKSVLTIFFAYEKEHKHIWKYYLTRQSKLIADGFKFNTLRDSILTQKRPPSALTN